MSKKILGISTTTLAVAAIGYWLYRKSKAAAPVNGLGYMPDTYLSYGPVNGGLSDTELAGFGSSFKRITKSVKNIASHSPALKITKKVVSLSKKPVDKVLKAVNRVPLVGKLAMPLVAIAPAILGAAKSSAVRAPSATALPVVAAESNEYYDSNNKRITESEYNRLMADYSRGVSYSDTQVPLTQQNAATVSASGGNSAYGYSEDIQPQSSSDGPTQRFDAAPSGTDDATIVDAESAEAPAEGKGGMMAVAAAAAAGAFMLFKR